MKITSVNVRKIEKEGSRMKGIASILLDDSFAVHDIRIIEGDAHPINPEVRSMFEDAILKAYEEAEDVTDSEE